MHDGRVVAAIPGQELVDGCPMYSPPAEESDAASRARRARWKPALDAPDLAVAARAAARCSDDRQQALGVREQYDGTVRAGTVMPPASGEAGVLQVAGTTFGGIAMTVDCNARHVLLDPYQGGMGAVAEAARNLACTGARPLGITDCLNFGNPGEAGRLFPVRRSMSWYRRRTCRAFGTPVTGGNVSLYNQNPQGAIDPTPTVGMVGLLADVTKAVPSHFRSAGDAILLLGETRGHLGGGAYWAEVLDTVGGAPPPVDLAAELALQHFLADAADAALLRSAHDLSDGGLSVALAECCIGGPWATASFGATIDLGHHGDNVPDTGWFFGEDGARALVSCDPAHVAELQRLAHSHVIPCHYLGLVEAAGADVVVQRDGRAWRWPVGRLRGIYLDAIPRRMAVVSAAGDN